MPRYIKIELGNSFPLLTLQIDATCKELEEVEYQESDLEAKEFVLRYQPEVEEENDESCEDTAEEELPRKTKYLSNYQTPRVEEFKSPVVKKKPTWKEAILLYVADDNGYMNVIELNTLIDHLEIPKVEIKTDVGDYDAYKKVLKSTNEVFSSQKTIEEYFEERKMYKNEMMEVKMDKTFHLTQNYKEGTKLVIDLYSKLLYKLKFKVNHEGITEAKIISMPNKVLITCSSSYITRIWSLLGLNLCILNIEYPLPYKWDLKINRFYQRKHKYIEAMRIKKQIDKKWYHARTSTMNNNNKAPYFNRDPLEKHDNIKTFKHLVTENKDDNAG